MQTGLAVLVGIFAVLWLPLAVLMAAATFWVFEGAQDLVRPWPLIGDRLASLFLNWETSFLNLASQAVTRAIELLDFANHQLAESVGAIARVVLGLIPQLVNTLTHDLGTLAGIVALTVLPPVEKELPVWLKHLDDELAQLPNEPAFRAGGPLSTLLAWVRAIVAALTRLGSFVRLVALPVLLVVGLLWGLVETLGRITRLEVLVNGLLGFTHNLDLLRQADEAAFAQLVVVVNGLLAGNQQLQVDLERERAARVALATQTQQAIAAATAAQAARIGQVSTQLAPLVILGVLASLGASGLDVLRKTAQCDPCGRLDSGDWSDLPARVEALENFGP